MKKNWSRWNRRRAEKTVAGFRFVFRDYDMTLSTLSGNWSMRLLCTEHPFGYLAASLRDGLDENLHGYALLMYALSTQMTRERRLVKDVEGAVRRYAGRIEREGARREKEVDRSDDMMELSQVLGNELKS